MFYGIDGCRAGWIVIGIATDGQYSVQLAGQFDQLCETISGATLSLVDMPIGLPSRAIPQRLCDTAARRLLGARRSSVFPVPARAALAGRDYVEACAINARELGKKISRQSWNIMPRIAEVDWALGRGLSQSQLREMHPEVAFTMLNMGVPMQASKKTAAGFAERMSVLTRWLPATAEIQQAARASCPSRQKLADDDILDALVGAVTASHYPALGTLPDTPIDDETGLAMEIVFSRKAYDG